MARRSPRRSAKKSVRRSPRRSAKKSVRKSVRRSPRRSAKKSVRKSVRRSPRRSAKKSVRKSARRSPRRSAKFVDKVVKVTSQNSKHYDQLGLVAKETDKTLTVISFVKKTSADCRSTREILIKERPFKTFTINKSSVDIVPDKTVQASLLKKARGMAYHWMLNYKTTKPYVKSTKITTIYKCKNHKG
jgi:hypothetical protein